MTNEDIKKEIQSCLYEMLTNADHNYLGLFMQELNLQLSTTIPAPAGVQFNKKINKFILFINPELFFKACDTREKRIAVFIHELLHILHLHLKRTDLEGKTQFNLMLENICMDMAINQYIKNLPAGCVNVDDWKNKDNQPLEKFKPFEYYLENIQDSLKNKQNSSGDAEKDFKSRNNNNKNDSEQNNKNDKNDKEYPNDKHIRNYKAFDDHDWASLSEEEKEKMLKELKETVIRTKEKTSYGHTKQLDRLDDLIREIESKELEFNHKRILKEAIKRSVTFSERKSTWKKPSKRFGYVAPGTKDGDQPKVDVYLDTSGSISIDELNESFQIITNFLNSGIKKINLGLWHTSLYSVKQIKRNTVLEKTDIQTGGTDVTETLEHIIKNQSDLSLIFTDGFFDKVDITIPASKEIIWIIRNDLQVNHPNNHIGKTVSYNKIK